MGNTIKKTQPYQKSKTRYLPNYLLPAQDTLLLLLLLQTLNLLKDYYIYKRVLSYF